MYGVQQYICQNNEEQRPRVLIFNALLGTRCKHKVRLLILRNPIQGEYNSCVRRCAVAILMALTGSAPIFL